MHLCYSAQFADKSKSCAIIEDAGVEAINRLHCASSKSIKGSAVYEKSQVFEGKEKKFSLHECDNNKDGNKCY